MTARAAFVIGCQETLQPEDPRHLRGLSKDVELMRSMLLDPALGGFDPDLSVFATDVVEETGFIERLSAFLGRLPDDSEVVLYYSGHAEPSFDFTDLVFNIGESRSFSYGQLQTRLRLQRVRRYGVILDCCQAGLALDSHRDEGLQHKGPRAGADRPGIVELVTLHTSSPDDSFVITSSRSNQRSHMGEGGAPSLFTEVLVDGIVNGRVGRGTVAELVQYSAQRLSQHPRFTEIRQQPTALSRGGASPLSIYGPGRLPPPAEPVVEHETFVDGFVEGPFRVPLAMIDWEFVRRYSRQQAPVEQSVELLSRRNLILDAERVRGEDYVVMRSEVLLNFCLEPDRWVSGCRTRVRGLRFEGSPGEYLNYQGPIATQFEQLRSVFGEWASTVADGAYADDQTFMRCLREAMSNALVHRDYRREHVEVEIGADGVRFTNPVVHQNVAKWLDEGGRQIRPEVLGRLSPSPESQRYTDILEQLGSYEGANQGAKWFAAYRAVRGDDAVTVQWSRSKSSVDVVIKYPVIRTSARPTAGESRVRSWRDRLTERRTETPARSTADDMPVLVEAAASTPPISLAPPDAAAMRTSVLPAPTPAGRPTSFIPPPPPPHAKPSTPAPPPPPAPTTSDAATRSRAPASAAAPSPSEAPETTASPSDATVTKPAPRKATERSAPTEPVSPPSAASTRAADPISTPLRRLDEDAGDTFLGRTARSYQVSSPLEERPKVKRHRAVPARETTSHGGSGALYGIGIFLLATRIAPKWIGDDTVVIVAAAVFAVVVRQIYLRFNVGVFLPCLILGYVAVSRDWAGLNEMLRVRLEHADFTPLVSVAGVLTCLLGRLIQE